MCYRKREDRERYLIVDLLILVILFSIGLPLLINGLINNSTINHNNNEVNMIYGYSDVQVIFNKSSFVKIDNTNCEIKQSNATSYIQCNDVTKNTQDNKCQMQGDCTETKCDACTFICYTKECWIKQQQLQCAEQMSKLKCLSIYTDKITYVCTNDPVNDMTDCINECTDFSCKGYDYKCNCLCTKHAINICDITKNDMIKTEFKIIYKANNTEYFIDSGYTNCHKGDNKCIDKYNMTKAIQHIYYDNADPTKYRGSIGSLYEHLPVSSILLIVFGSLFTGFACFLIICEIIVASKDSSCCRKVQEQTANERDYENFDDEKANGPVANDVINGDIKLEIIPSGQNDEAIIPENDAELECPICKDKLKDNQLDNEALLCGHVFHTSCILAWKHIALTCPICKREIEV
jgi:hypothetical protein